MTSEVPEIKPFQLVIFGQIWKYTGEATFFWSTFIVHSWKAAPLQQRLDNLFTNR